MDSIPDESSTFITRETLRLAMERFDIIKFSSPLRENTLKSMKKKALRKEIRRLEKIVYRDMPEKKKPQTLKVTRYGPLNFPI